jgi:hypothetical protein
MFLIRSWCYWWGHIHVCCLGCAVPKPIGVCCAFSVGLILVGFLCCIYRFRFCITLNNNFLQKLIQNLNLQIQHKKTKSQPSSNQWKKQKQKMDNLHLLWSKNRENHKPIQEYPLRVPIPYNNSQNQNWPVILRNRTRAASINLCVIHAKCHILYKQAAV